MAEESKILQFEKFVNESVAMSFIGLTEFTSVLGFGSFLQGPSGRDQAWWIAAGREIENQPSRSFSIEIPETNAAAPLLVGSSKGVFIVAYRLHGSGSLIEIIIESIGNDEGNTPPTVISSQPSAASVWSLFIDSDGSLRAESSS